MAKRAARLDKKIEKQQALAAAEKSKCDPALDELEKLVTKRKLQIAAAG